MSDGDFVYLGIDLNDRNAMISYLKPNMEEPMTISPIAGSENYAVPVILAKRRNLGMWYYGDEALKIAKSSDLICIDALLRRSLADEELRIDNELYSAVDLLALFLKKLIQLSGKLGNLNKFTKLVISVERLNEKLMETLWKVAERLKLDRGRFMVIDHRESFYYYTVNQEKSLWYHDVCLITHDKDYLYAYTFKRDQKTKPQVVSILETQKLPMTSDKDATFLHFLNQLFDRKMISTVYLVGSGFDGGWMNQSLNFLCRGRRAFIGNNLFTKGACYAAYVNAQEAWPYVYMGENEMKFNISLKMLNRGNMEFYTLISAGKNWFESEGVCEVILSGTPEIDFWKQLPHSREAIVETLELTDLPGRPDKATRLRITAKPSSVDRVVIEIKDLGFGEIFRSSEKSWKYTMTM